jgi:hypothetical protein
VQAPAYAWAILIPGLSVHVSFGVASGWVTHHLVRAIDRADDARSGKGGPGENTIDNSQHEAPAIHAAGDQRPKEARSS